MKKINLLILALMLFIHSSGIAIAASSGVETAKGTGKKKNFAVLVKKVQKLENRVENLEETLNSEVDLEEAFEEGLTPDSEDPFFEEASLSNASNQVRYVRVKEADLNLLRRQARANVSIQQRIRNLEDAYEQVLNILSGVNRFVRLVRTVLGLADEEEIDNRDNEDLTGRREDPSTGIVMEPASVQFSIKTFDGGSFRDQGLNEFQMDVFFNKELFEISEISGPGVNGREFTRVSLPRNTRSSKTRVKLPISDVLNNETSFFIFLKPKKNKVKVGDETNITIEYFNRIPRNPDGSRGVQPLIYERVSDNDFVKVSVI